MNIKKTLLASVVALTFVVGAHGQSQPFSSTYEVQKVPANPDVAQLGRFGDIPVNKYNGTANISIPIYEIDHDGLKIPIALKYNTGGVRVEQEASWVGLGWSLSDGMTITREVNGYEDIYNFDHLNAESVGWIYARDYLSPNSEDGYTIPGELSEMDLNELQDSYNSGNNPIDTQPDFFTVNLPSGSCKFTLPKIVNSATVLTGIVSDNKNFKVLYDRVNYKFTITDPSGFLYDFSVIEMSTGYGSYEKDVAPDYSTKLSGVMQAIKYPIFHARHMISSWRVAKITSPLGRELDFTYEDGFYFSFPHFSESQEILSGNWPEFLPPWNKDVEVVPMPATFGTMTAFNVKNLSLISGHFGSVDFVFSDRTDLVSKADKIALSGFSPSIPWNSYQLFGDALIAKKVDQIVVKNNVSEIIKTATLGYSYFNSQWVGIEPIYNGSDPFESDIAYTRLKLDQVDIGDQRYTFEYHQPNALPKKHSRSVDFWGFYNGKTNTTKVPSFNRFYVNHPGFANGMDDEWHEFFIKITGGNRSADINFGKIGSLEKITYPTGGYTLLEYEGNKTTMSNITFSTASFVSDGSQLRFTDLTSSTDYKYSYQYMKLAKTPTYSLNDYNTYYDPCKVSTTTVNPNTQFQITETSFCNGLTYNVKVNASTSCGVGCGLGIYPSGNAVWIRNVNTSQEYSILTYGSSGGSAIEQTLNLPVGTYELKTANWSQPSPTVVYTASAYITRYFSEVVTPPNIPIANEEFEVGGARIKSVSSYEADGTRLSKSGFLYDQYVTVNGEQVSNGKLMDELIFHSKAQNLFDYTAIDFMGNAGSFGAMLSSDMKIRTNPSAAGSHIGYSLVREEKLDLAGNKLGQTVTEFINKPNEYILKPSEVLPKIVSGPVWADDFHTTIYDLEATGSGYDWYLVQYGSVYNLSLRPITFDHENGSVIKESAYDQVGGLIRQTSNSYTAYPVYVPSTGAVGVTGAQFSVPYFLANSIIHFQPYAKISWPEFNINRMNALVSSSTIEYVNGTPSLTTTTANYYENSSHYLMTSTATTGSDGSLYTTKYYYPKDLPAVPFMNDLVAQNQVTTPAIVERYKGTSQSPYTTLLEKVQTFYTNTNSPAGSILPKEVITYELGETTGQQRVVYEKYNGYGVLSQYRKSDNDIPVTLLWGHYKLLPIAQITNALFTQVAFTGFDEPLSTDGGWEITTSTTSTTEFKTGSKSLNPGGTITKTSLPNGDYVVGFWAKVVSGTSGTVTINGAQTNITGTTWKYYEVIKSGTSMTVSNSNVYIDELRLHPVGAQMTSYTYKSLVGMTSQTDANGKVTTFEYDTNGRLKVVRDPDGNIIKSNDYHYKQ